MDQDDLKRLNGAEKEDYDFDGKDYRPSNEILKDFEELRLIQGFDEYSLTKKLVNQTSITIGLSSP